MSLQDQLRSRRIDNDDPRVLRTRRKLIDAYRSLLDEENTGAITVTAVVDRAGVTRSAFYTHFASTSDLASSALTEFTDRVISLARSAVREGGSKREINERVILQIARFVARRRDVYGPLLARGDEFMQATIDVFTELNLATLRTREHVDGDPEVTARYVASGTIGVLTWWLGPGADRSAEELAAAVIAISPRDFAG